MARHFVMSKCADLEHNGLENSFKSCLKNSLGSQLKICISPKVSPVQVLQCIFRFVGWGEDIAKFCETFLNHDAGPCLVLQKTLQKKKKLCSILPHLHLVLLIVYFYYTVQVVEILALYTLHFLLLKGKLFLSQ